MLVLLAIVIALAALLWYWCSIDRLGHIPSPKGWPFIGHILNLEPRSAHITLTRWSEQLGHIFCVQIWRDKMVVLSSYDAIYEAVITKKDSVAGRPLKKGYRTYLLMENKDIVRANPSPRWKLIRNTCHRHLKLQGDNRSKLEEIILDIITDMLGEFKKHNEKPFDPKATIFQTTVSVTCALLVGKKYTVNNELMQMIIEFQRQLGAVTGTGASGLLLDACPWLRYLGNSVYKTIVEIIKMRDTIWSKIKEEAQINMKTVGHDNIDAGLVALLLKLQTDQGVTGKGISIEEYHIKVTFHNLLAAGIITTSNSFYALLNILSQHPSVQEKMQKEVDSVVGASMTVTLDDRPRMPFTQATILELLRYTSIVPLAIPHETLEETTVQGVRIPSGTTVHLNLWALHHDKSLWDQPFMFHPERFLDQDGQLLDASSPERKHLLPFGAGTRVCVGEVFAMARLFLMTANTIREFKIQHGPKLSSHDPRNYEGGTALRPQDYDIVVNSRV